MPKKPEKPSPRERYVYLVQTADGDRLVTTAPDKKRISGIAKFNKTWKSFTLNGKQYTRIRHWSGGNYFLVENPTQVYRMYQDKPDNADIWEEFPPKW